jgi:hypothetical protein
MQSRLSSAWEERQGAQAEAMALRAAHAADLARSQITSAPAYPESPPFSAQHSVVGSDVVPPPVSECDTRHA